MTGLPRRSDSDTFWSGVAFSVKSGARVLGARIAGCCGSGAGLVAMVPDTSGWTNDTQPSKLTGRVVFARPQPRALGQRLESRRIVCSMRRKANCWDNAVSESFFATLKTELVHHEDFRTRVEARSALFEYIEVFYNRTRR